MNEPTVLLSGLGIPESPRWHQGRLWFCNWIDRQVMATDLDGRAGRLEAGRTYHLRPDRPELVDLDRRRPYSR